MPWKVFSEDGKSKVYKVDSEGKKVGSPLGTHGDPKKADAQVRALYASEKKPKKEMGGPVPAGILIAERDEQETFVPAGAGTITATVTDDEALKELHEKMGYAEPAMAVMVEMPGPLTFADLMAEEAAREAQMEMYELTDQFGRLSRNIMNSSTEDKAAALMALANEYAALVGEKVKEEITEDKAQTIAKQIAGDNQPASNPTPDTSDTPGGDSDDATTSKAHDLFIWKENDRYYCLLAYSNNRRDDDNPPEIISSESHKEFDLALEKGEWPMPELWLWHIPYKVGDVFYHAYDEQNGFPIAGAVFDKDKDWLAEGLLKAGWDGVSHGMPEQWIQRDKEDPTVIVRHRTKEISILPKWAAANKLAFTYVYKENEMAEQEKSLPAHKREALNELGEDKAQKFLEALGETAEKADEAGIEKKEAETPQEQPLTPDSPVVKALELVVSQLAALDTRLKAIEEKQVEAAEEKEQPFDLMEFLKGKSAIGQPTAKVDGRSKEAKDGPEEVKPESWTEKTTGFRVSLVDELVGANQEYYQSRQ